MPCIRQRHTAAHSWNHSVKVWTHAWLRGAPVRVRAPGRARPSPSLLLLLLLLYCSCWWVLPALRASDSCALCVAARYLLLLCPLCCYSLLLDSHVLTLLQGCACEHRPGPVHATMLGAAPLGTEIAS
jgi:hypothetical protein